MPTISYDPAKREATLKKRGVDFNDAAVVFEGLAYEWLDDRVDYGETRIVSAGWLNGRMMIVVWTPRGETRHVISMRKANARERAKIGKRLEAH